jgi:hypothetical protein
MTVQNALRPSRLRKLALLTATAASASVATLAQQTSKTVALWPGNLVVSRSVYDNRASNVQVGAILPPNCTSTTGGCAASTGAPFDGTYPLVWNNDGYDSSFGITSRIYLDQISIFGSRISTIEVPNSLDRGVDSKSDQLVTSFSSKSEIALNLSTDRRYLTFMGYVAPVDSIDVSNSNTPGAPDPTNPVGEAYDRAVATIDDQGRFTFTKTNAYSGNNGRAAILSNLDGAHAFFTAGNAGNGSNPQPNGIVLGAGAQWIPEFKTAEYLQSPGTPTPLSSFSVTELGDKSDKIGKDDNFRGLTIFNDVVYYTKGSGSNGVNTVYFVDTTGKACPTGVGLPVTGAKLPSAPLVYDPATLATAGLPSNMCILAGFPTALAKTATTVAFPFGLWFADPHTLYVADEGDGYTGGTDLYTHAAAQTTAGLQKWVFNTSSKTWQMVYVLKNELGIGVPYSVANYPSGNNPATNLPWAPATDGLRNITGLNGPDGLVAIWGITSTVSGNGDTGADPNRLFVVVDKAGNTDPSLATVTPFIEVTGAKFGEVLRGVSFTPGTDFDGAGRNLALSLR